MTVITLEDSARFTRGRRYGVLFLCAVGIMALFIVYGLVQEKIMTTPYGPDSERFTDTALLVLLNRLVAIVVAAWAAQSSLLARVRGDTDNIAAAGMNNSEESIQSPGVLTPIAPLSHYGLIAACNFMATFCQYEALKYVTFPTQTLGKCAKMLPVLVLGTWIGQKSYPWRDYAVASLVMSGCAIFLTTGPVVHHRAAETDTPWGLSLMLFYLALDGATSTLQERLFRQHKMSTAHQMLFVNFFSLFFAILALCLPSPNSGSRLIPAFGFLLRHADFALDALLLSLCSSGGQMLIYYTIKEFGALIYSTIMTTRQCFSVILSAFLFSHPVSSTQWVGASMVFSSLYWQALDKHRRRPSK